MLSGLVFAGAGGVNNLAQSNWIRDKGFGMGDLHPAYRVADHRRRSRRTGDRIDDAAGRGEPAAFPRLVGVANKEQLVSFWFICIFSITVFSALAYSTVFGQSIPGQANLAFIQAEGEALKTIVAPWFGTFFWVFGSLSMILVALGTIDYIARIVADVLKTVICSAANAGRRAASTSWCLGNDRRRVHHPAVRFQSAAAAAGDCGVPERHGDVCLLDPAHPAQSARAAAGDSRQRSAPGHADVRDGVLRLLRGMAGAGPGPGIPGGTMTRSGTVGAMAGNPLRARPLA